MARRYEIDELLHLRSSPLVAKPPGLPPIEEWMYATRTPRNGRHLALSRIHANQDLHRPQPDPTTQRKQSNTRDPTNPSETTTNRRPSFFEARHISRGSNSGALVSSYHFILCCYAPPIDTKANPVQYFQKT